MSAAPAAVIAVIDDATLRGTAERAAAAAGLHLVFSSAPARRNWLAAAAVIVDEAGARRCAEIAMPRRDRVLLITEGEPVPSALSAALAVGALDVCSLPEGEGAILRHFGEAAELAASTARPGRVIAVTSGRGGAGASVFAAALAQSAALGETEALLVDLDAWGGGLDLLLGAERATGLRWPDIRFDRGRLNWSSLSAALPNARGVHMLSSSRAYHEINAEFVAAVVDSGRRAGATVVCDVPRQLTPSALCALEAADLVVVVTTCDVRAIAATAALTGAVKAVNPNIGLVVRGPAPGGLRAGEAGDVAAVPVLATMRAEPLLPAHLEQHGLGLRRRSPLAAAAGKILRLFEASGAAVA